MRFNQRKFCWNERAAGGVLALAAAEVIPLQTGVEGLNGTDRGSGGTASRLVRRMVAQSNS
jgi:hypothetical protein